MTGTAEDTFAVETLRRCALFARFNDDALAACAGSLRVRRFRKNETIFHQGDPGDSLFIIESGAVKIVLPSPEGEEMITVGSPSWRTFGVSFAVFTPLQETRPTRIAEAARSALVIWFQTFPVVTSSVYWE